jgi:anti-sigma factor RsiW
MTPMHDPVSGKPHASSDDDLLVAYLDGELDAAESARVELRLGREPELRLRLQELQRTWDVLDELPRSASTDLFVKSTIEMVATRARREARGHWSYWRRRLMAGMGWVAAGAACVAVSFAVADRIQSAPHRQLLRDLAVIERVDQYRHVDSVDFLVWLDRENLFPEELPDEGR